ncbi:MAG: carboxymuconolactone decarboxylase family protein [Alphaproteobacteria bacterium]|nr:carboxymuconolactone decarboxylase family protein [Alphaproteobacteria bacterium]
MSDASERGRALLERIFGADYVAARDGRETDFTSAYNRLAEEAAYGLVWARDGLDLKTRSLLTIASLTALGRAGELRVHLLAAVNNGASADEIREAILHTAIYAGFPAARDATQIAQQVLQELGKLPAPE